MAQETYTGTVSWFSVTKGYGVCLQVVALQNRGAALTVSSSSTRQAARH